jgi:hypothetical protein
VSPFDELYDRLGPFKKIVISYHGAGDEGWIEDITPEPEVEGFDLAHDLYKELEEAAYEILEENYGGWEINEGSTGHMTVDVVERQVFIHHGTIVESVEYEDTVIK